MINRYWLTTRKWLTGGFAFLSVALAGGYEHTGNPDVAFLAIVCAMFTLVLFTSVVD